MLGTSPLRRKPASESTKESVSILVNDLPSISKRPSTVNQSSAASSSKLGSDLNDSTTNDALTDLNGYLPTPPKSKKRSKKKSKDGEDDGRKETDPLDENTKIPDLGMTVEETRMFNAACNAGKVPDTDLSRLIYKNWIRFPGCVILYRVGSFYEVSVRTLLAVSS